LLLAGIKTALDSRSPLALLARGYCVAEKEGTVIRRVDAIAPGDQMKIRFYDGSSLVNVERVDHDGNV
ncbi:MAG: exodeoxyribonuclease VII large subunit, partial [Methanoregula sp.]|nr:exodeoxyribonuclease VII large subunit [Methanoregula sp.]